MERKTETVNLRVTPELKELIRLAADREHRAIANFIDVLVREHCQKHGIAVPAKQSELLANPGRVNGRFQVSRASRR